MSSGCRGWPKAHVRLTTPWGKGTRGGDGIAVADEEEEDVVVVGRGFVVVAEGVVLAAGGGLGDVLAR